MNNIGKRIKKLRRKRDLTQEKLADYLGVTYQSVSKWETGVTFPDLSLIVPLSRVLEVSTDELLGAREVDERLKELKDSYLDTFKTGDMDERIRIAKLAVEEYPDNMKWLCDYAWTIWCHAIGMLHDGEEFEAEREKAIKMFDRVIGNTDDDAVKQYAIQGIVQCLCGKGCKAEARRYVEMFPETKVGFEGKDELLGKCLDGDEQIRHKQKLLNWYLGTILQSLLWYQNCDHRYASAAVKGILEAMIPDGNYCSHYFEMSHANFRLAEVAVNDGEYDEAIELLRESVRCAKEYDTMDSVNLGEYSYTAPLFDKLTEDSREWCHTGKGTLFDDIKNVSTWQVFDVIRDRDDFKALFE